MVNIYEDLVYRGLIKDFSNEDRIKEMLNSKQVIYCGFDPSASSMHMGNFVMVMTLMRLQRAGHKIIGVVGGGTGMIGDPGGRDSERQLLNRKQADKNTLALRKQLAKYLDLEDTKNGEIINNEDWLGNFKLIDFLRDVGKHFTINYMLAKESVSRRLETGISYTEFSYMLLQAYDFLYLHEKKGVTMQIGGSDQWGNLTAGLDLIRKVKGPDANVEVMTAHLLTNSDGKKFGKSVDGALFIDKDLFSPYRLYQYFINVSDEDAAKLLKALTFLTKDEIETLLEEHSKDPGKRLAQYKLASEVVTIVHNGTHLERAIKMSEALFSGDVSELEKEEIIELFGDVTIKIAEKSKLEDVLIEVGAASSKREAREFLRNNSILLNGKRVNDGEALLTKKDALHNKFLIIRRGKKRYFVATF
ncbi:MAG TPA: tyrosine--tRNA ligase [Bacilli bacterium]|nr:tyrosine--tRNA ligase [Bacilli bacterium]